MTASPHQARNIALLVAAAFFMQLLDGVIIVTALPEMAADFEVEPLAMSIGVTIYILAAAIFIPTGGWLADRFGARRVFVIAILLFTAASLVCGFCTRLPEFVAARAVQGVGGAVMLPVGRLLVLRNVEKSEIVTAIGLTVWPALFAPVIGPLIGGFLTTYVGWEWNFWINVPVGLLGVALVPSIIPADRETVGASFDWGGFVLCGASLAGLLYGFEGFANGTLPHRAAILLIALGAGAGVAAVLWLNRRRHPLLDLSTLRIATFTAAEVTGGAALRLAINATPFLLPLMFQITLGLDPFQAGGLVLAYFLGNLLMKVGTTRILRWVGFRNVLVVNGVLAALAMALCGFFGPETPYPVVVAILIAAGLTRSMQFTALTTMAFADVEAAHRSSASTIAAMSQQLAIAFGIALASATLNLSKLARGGERLTVHDFAVAHWLMAAIVLVASLSMLRLPSDAGAEVSGHRRAGGR